MADDFGDLVRMARERRGLSMARLGDLVGRSRSTVRAWERGESVPGDPSVISALSAVLDLDEDDLYEAAGIDRPSLETRPTVEQALATLRSDPAPSPRPGSTGDDSRGRGAHLRPEEEGSPLSPPSSPSATRADSVPSPGRAPVAVAGPAIGRPERAPSGPATSYLEQPGERMRYRLRVVATVCAVGALVVALIWAFGEFRVAMADVWDALRGSPAG